VLVGKTVGSTEGWDGAIVGDDVGYSVRFGVGAEDGTSVRIDVGTDVGTTVGFGNVGNTVG